MKATKRATRGGAFGRAAALVVLSVMGHLAITVPPAMSVRAAEIAPRAPIAKRAGLAKRMTEAAKPVIVAADRRALVEQARADRAAGRLALGEFLLRASAIDARETGHAFDLDRARALYGERLDRIRGTDDLRATVPKAFGDLHYFGRPGGTMGDALIERGGSCEPLAHLISSAIHDTGHPERAKLRFYGGEGESGATHLAPVLPDGDREYDLLAGTTSKQGGVSFEAEELVEIYARAHGLSPKAASKTSNHGGGEGGREQASDSAPPPAQSTMGSGYPPNGDRFSGEVPLYAHSAVQTPFQASQAAKAPAIDPTDCAFFVRIAALDPPELRVTEGDRDVEVELFKKPTGAQLDRIFGVVQAVEQKAAMGSQADRLMSQACLAALYDQASIGQSLSGDHDLAKHAAERAKKARLAGEAGLAEIDWDSNAGGRALADLADRYAGRSFLLLMLRGGEAPLMRLASTTKIDWGRISATAALLVSPKARRAAIPLAEAFPRAQQIHVMHEVFRAHDHARPWATNYALDGAGEGEFARAYRAFRGLAWGLWEGARPTSEVLDGLLREADRGALGRAWVVALLDYYGRNAIALHEHRTDWPAFSTGLKRWLFEHGFTDIDLYENALEGVPNPT